MARGAAFILVEFSLVFSWDMRASVFENSIAQTMASGAVARSGERPSRKRMLAPLGGQCKSRQALSQKLCY
jgi:hypothetical protein